MISSGMSPLSKALDDDGGSLLKTLEAIWVLRIDRPLNLLRRSGAFRKFDAGSPGIYQKNKYLGGKRKLYL